MERTDIRSKLSEIHDEKKISFSEMAREMGISPSTVSNFIGYVTYPQEYTLSQMEKYIDRMGVVPVNEDNPNSEFIIIDFPESEVTTYDSISKMEKLMSEWIEDNPEVREQIESGEIQVFEIVRKLDIESAGIKLV